MRSRVECWNDEEAWRFLDTAQDDGYGAIWIIVLHTGMRKGELLELQWGDVDLARGVTHVRRGGS